MTQPKTLFLADVLEDTGNSVNDAAAAELRRLHAENEALTAANEQFGKRQEWWNEKMFALEAERDALLEACKAYDQWADKTLCYDRVLRPIRAQIRAAIAKAAG